MVCFTPANVELVMHPIHMNSLAPFQRAVSFGVKYRKAEGCACDAVQCQKAGTRLWKWMVPCGLEMLDHH